MVDSKLTNTELAVMDLLWNTERMTARQILEQLYADSKRSQHGTVQRRLGLAVHEGELSLEQAQIMMEALRRSSHEAEHKQRDHHNYEHRNHHNYDDQEDVARRIATALAEAGVEGEATRPAMVIIRRLAGHIAEQGNSFKLDEETVDRFFGETNFNREQMRVIVGIAERLADSSEEAENSEREDEERDDDDK